VSSLAHSLKMRHESWHSRWYHHWLSLGGKKPTYKENLCRYAWILVLWAPLRWFFKGRIKKVPPWTIGLPLLIVSITTAAVNVWPGWALNALKWTGIVVGSLIGLVVLLLIFAYLCEEYTDQMKRIGKTITSPVWILPYGIYRIGKPVWKRLARWTDEVFGWFFGEVYPVGLVIVAGLVLGLVYESHYTVKALEILGSIVGAVVVMILAIFVFSKEGLGLSRSIKRGSIELLDTLKLAVTYLGTKKRGSRICPFIEFEDTQAA